MTAAFFLMAGFLSMVIALEWSRRRKQNRLVARLQDVIRRGQNRTWML